MSVDLTGSQVGPVITECKPVHHDTVTFWVVAAHLILVVIISERVGILMISECEVVLFLEPFPWPEPVQHTLDFMELWGRNLKNNVGCCADAGDQASPAAPTCQQLYWAGPSLAPGAVSSLEETFNLSFGFICELRFELSELTSWRFKPFHVSLAKPVFMGWF